MFIHFEQKLIFFFEENNIVHVFKYSIKFLVEKDLLTRSSKFNTGFAGTAGGDKFIARRI